MWGRGKTCEKWALGALIFFAFWLFVILPFWHAWDAKWFERHASVINAINAFSTLVMAVLTFFLVKLNSRLAASSTRVADVTQQAMRVSSKAYVFADVVKDSVVNRGASVIFQLHVMNYGKTPAMVEEVAFASAAAVPSGPAQYANVTKAPDQFNLGSPDDVKLKGVFSTPSDQPYIMGYVVFRDVFNKPNTSRFCRYLDERRGTFEIAGGAEWNRFDYETGRDSDAGE